jgi:hypothetical protein
MIRALGPCHVTAWSGTDMVGPQSAVGTRCTVHCEDCACVSAPQHYGVPYFIEFLTMCLVLASLPAGQLSAGRCRVKGVKLLGFV